MNHFIHLLCDSRNGSTIIADTLTNQLPFLWSGGDFDFKFALAVGGTYLTAADVGSIKIEIKELSATAEEAPLFRRVIGASDCDSTFTAGDWTGGVKSLATVEISAAEFTQTPDKYRLIVEHTDPAGRSTTHLSTALLLLEDALGDESEITPPVPAASYYDKTVSDARFAPVSALVSIATEQEQLQEQVTANQEFIDGVSGPLWLYITGQSNCGWANTDLVNGVDAEPGVQVYEPSTKTFGVWTDDSWMHASYGAGRNVINGFNPNVWARHLAIRLHKITGREVRCVFQGKGSQTMSQNYGNWATSNGYSDQLEDLKENEGLVEFDAVCFALGESDSTNISTGAQTLSTFSSEFYGFRDNLRDFTQVIKNDTPWIILEQLESHATADLLNFSFWNTLSFPFVVLPTAYMANETDNIHYTEEALREIGNQLAPAAFFGESRGTSDFLRVSKWVSGEYQQPSQLDQRADFPSRVLDVFISPSDPTFTLNKGYLPAGVTIGDGVGLGNDRGHWYFYAKSLDVTGYITTTAAAVSSNFTLSLLVTAGGATNDRNVFASSGTSDYLTFGKKNGSRYSLRHGTSKTEEDLTGFLTIGTGGETHVFTYVMINGQLSLYIDGILQDDANSTNYKTAGGGSSEVALGDLPFLSNVSFLNTPQGDEAHAEVRIFSMFMATVGYTSSQVSALYASTKSQYSGLNLL